MSNDKKEEIIKLVNLINKWNEEYFDNDNPSVSDRVYDSHLKQLIELEQEYPEYVLENSPTKKIGASVKNKFKKVKHEKPMLSLNKAFDFNEIEKFFNDITNSISRSNISFLVEPKIDGLSISLKYENGTLVQATTRGDGEFGEDVTSNVKNIISSIPTEIEYKNILEVRGEIYISKTNFEKIKIEENVDYANARNLASGTLRQLDNSIVKKRNLSAFIYEVVDYEKNNIKSQQDLVNFLNKNNFPFLQDYIIESLDNKEKIFNFINEFEEGRREELEYEIDGMVLKLNEVQYYEELGYTSKFPKFAIAYKFNDEIINTNIEDIFITIGRTGIVTYNAVLKPVLLKGTTISAATLHNYNYIEELNLNIGDEVFIKKAGEIIPKVVGISKKISDGVFQKIMICPHCNSSLIDTKTLNNQICINEDCPEINIKKITHFASKKAMNIEGLGEGIVRKFFELDFLKSIEDIFKLELHKDKIIANKGFGPKFWSNLKDGIDKSFNVELSNLIFALGIPQLGSRNAKSIANSIREFKNILNIDSNSLMEIMDIGEITIDEFSKYISNPKNIELINYLINLGINPTIKETKIKIDFFKDKTFVITGTFDISRNELIKIIEENGGIVSSSISKKTSFLLAGNDVGSKLDKAKSLNIKIINKDELKKILDFEGI